MMKKDYEKLAEVLVSQRHYISQFSYMKLVTQIGMMYKRDNERFNMDKWLSACGV